MAHILFGNTTVVPAFDPNITTPFDVESTVLVGLEEQATVETPALTEPAYLVEVHNERRSPRLLAVRETLDDAKYVADAVHPSAADIVIHEVQLPCDVVTFVSNVSRSWRRAPSGEWTLTP
jgi:hypothetical protein